MKDFKDWTFDDLVADACWDFIQGISKGMTLRATMWKICNVTCQWREEQIKKEKAGKK